MNFIFCKLKNLKQHEFHFLQAKKPQKTLISFFASYKNIKQVVPNRVKVATDGNIFEDKTFSIHFTMMFKVSGRSALTGSLRQ